MILKDFRGFREKLRFLRWAYENRDVQDPMKEIKFLYEERIYPQIVRVRRIVPNDIAENHEELVKRDLSHQLAEYIERNVSMKIVPSEMPGMSVCEMKIRLLTDTAEKAAKIGKDRIMKFIAKREGL